MSLLDMMKKRTVERHVGGNHPIIKMDVARNVREAYFQGLLFAAFADDGKIDEQERARLEKVGLSLEIPENEMVQMTADVEKMDEADRLALMEDVAAALKGTSAPFLFLCEFSMIWLSHEGDREKLKSYRLHLSDPAWLGTPCEDAFYERFDDVVLKVKDNPALVFTLTDRFTEETLAYLFAEVEDIFRLFAAERARADRQIPAHPLKGQLDDATKEKYLAGCILAFPGADRTIGVWERNQLHKLAVALGLDDAAVEAGIKQLPLPLSAEKRGEALAELAKALEDRSRKFFSYCDMAKVLFENGYDTLSGSAETFLDEVALAYALEKVDRDFLASYRTYLVPERGPKVTELLSRSGLVDMPAGFLSYYTPKQDNLMRTLVLPGGAEMRFIWCDPGSFMRFGHKVTLTKGFWLGETPVTQKQWESVMNGNPSLVKGLNNPVDNVSWNDCQRFIAVANEALQCVIRLPTEAEWEYACRAGSTGDYSGTGKLDEMGWYSGNSGGMTHPVAKKSPNHWGFYDMHGNVWEWCADWYVYTDEMRLWNSDPCDPLGPATSNENRRVSRGGSQCNSADNCRSSSRNCGYPTVGRSDLNLYGFRVALAAV